MGRFDKPPILSEATVHQFRNTIFTKKHLRTDRLYFDNCFPVISDLRFSLVSNFQV